MKKIPKNGMEFEFDTRIFSKERAKELLEKEKNYDDYMMDRRLKMERKQK